MTISSSPGTVQFEACLAFTLEREGGFVNNPADPGGATNLGITLRTLSAWRGHTVSVADVRTLGRTEAGAIYRAQFWSAVHGDDLPAGLDLAVFDWAVNSGVSRAVMGLQWALGIAADGHFGLVTADTLRRHGDTAGLIHALCGRRLSILEQIKTWKFFGKGWAARVEACEAVAHKMVHD